MLVLFLTWVSLSHATAHAAMDCSTKPQAPPRPEVADEESPTGFEPVFKWGMSHRVDIAHQEMACRAQPEGERM